MYGSQLELKTFIIQKMESLFWNIIFKKNIWFEIKRRIIFYFFFQRKNKLLIKRYNVSVSKCVTARLYRFRPIYFTPFELLQCMLNITIFYDLKRKTIDFKDTGLKINVRSSKFQMLRYVWHWSIYVLKKTISICVWDRKVKDYYILLISRCTISF